MPPEPPSPVPAWSATAPTRGTTQSASTSSAAHSSPRTSAVLPLGGEGRNVHAPQVQFVHPVCGLRGDAFEEETDHLRPALGPRQEFRRPLPPVPGSAGPVQRGAVIQELHRSRPLEGRRVRGPHRRAVVVEPVEEVTGQQARNDGDGAPRQGVHPVPERGEPAVPVDPEMLGDAPQEAHPGPVEVLRLLRGRQRDRHQEGEGIEEFVRGDLRVPPEEAGEQQVGLRRRPAEFLPRQGVEGPAKPSPRRTGGRSAGGGRARSPAARPCPASPGTPGGHPPRRPARARAPHPVPHPVPHPWSCPARRSPPSAPSSPSSPCPLCSLCAPCPLCSPPCGRR